MFFPVCDCIFISNGFAFIKVLLAFVVGVLGIYGVMTNGVANEYTVEPLLPLFDLYSLLFIFVILLNFLGFEVVCTFTDDMKDPKKQVLQAIAVGGIVITSIYIFLKF